MNPRPVGLDLCQYCEPVGQNHERCGNKFWSEWSIKASISDLESDKSVKPTCPYCEESGLSPDAIEKSASEANWSWIRIRHSPLFLKLYLPSFKMLFKKLKILKLCEMAAKKILMFTGHLPNSK